MRAQVVAVNGQIAEEVSIARLGCTGTNVRNGATQAGKVEHCVHLGIGVNFGQ
jgi:hypothetical protein